MYDEERSLVSEMEKAGKPFALIGVNVNDELGHIQNVVKEKDLNWRSRISMCSCSSSTRLWKNAFTSLFSAWALAVS